DERFDGTLSDAATKNLVFRTNLLRARMRRPFDAGGSKWFEPDLDGAIRAVERGVEVNPQTGDGSEIDRADSVLAQSRQALVRGDCVARQELALGAGKGEREAELVVISPSLLGQECLPRGQVRQRRLVRRRRPGATACDQVELGDTKPFFPGGDELRAFV